MSPVVHIPFLILTKPVIVFIVGRLERGPHLIKLRIFRPPVIVKLAVIVLVVQHSHFPAQHIQYWFAVRSCDRHERSAVKPAVVLPWSSGERAVGPPRKRNRGCDEY